MGSNWEYRMVAELDSELNSWLDSVPDNRRLTQTRAILLHADHAFYSAMESTL